MNSTLLTMAGELLMQADWVWGVIGIVLGVLAENALNRKPARARTSRPRDPR